MSKLKIDQIVYIRAKVTGGNLESRPRVIAVDDEGNEHEDGSIAMPRKFIVEKKAAAPAVATSAALPPSKILGLPTWGYVRRGTGDMPSLVWLHSLSSDGKNIRYYAPNPWALSNPKDDRGGWTKMQAAPVSQLVKREVDVNQMETIIDAIGFPPDGRDDEPGGAMDQEADSHTTTAGTGRQS